MTQCAETRQIPGLPGAFRCGIKTADHGPRHLFTLDDKDIDQVIALLTNPTVSIKEIDKVTTGLRVFCREGVARASVVTYLKGIWQLDQRQADALIENTIDHKVIFEVREGVLKTT